nr:antimicrobial peptide P2 [uncultured bacterium]
MAAALCVRAAVFKRGESNGYDPKPGDLRVGKVKRAERRVEAC